MKMSEEHVEKFNLLEKAFVAFAEAGKQMHVPAPLPDPSAEPEEQLMQAVRYASENLTISSIDVHERLEHGEQPPVFDDARIEIILKAWESYELRIGAVMTSIGKGDKERPKRRLVDIIRENGGDEKELVLARIRDVFDDLALPGYPGTSMPHTMSGQVIDNELSVAEANRLLDYPEALREVATLLEKERDFMRRQTLLDLGKKPGFLPDFGINIDQSSTKEEMERLMRLSSQAYTDFQEFCTGDTYNEQMARTSRVVGEQAKRKKSLVWWTVMPTVAIGTAWTQGVVMTFAGFGGLYESPAAFATGFGAGVAGAAVSGFVAYMAIRNNKYQKNLIAMTEPLFVLMSYTGDPSPGSVPQNVREAFNELSQVTTRLSQPKSLRSKIGSVAFKAAAVAVTVGAIVAVSFVKAAVNAYLTPPEGADQPGACEIIKPEPLAPAPIIQWRFRGNMRQI
jgi:hypothetical protein